MPKSISSINISSPSDKKLKTVTKRFKTDKSKGQHLLRSDQIVKKIIDAGHINESSTILEIGPGTGNLTIPMARKAKFIYAYEVDPLMVKELKRRLSELDLLKKVKIINQDFLKSELPNFDKCISNIPYKISSKIVFRLLEHSKNNRRFKSAVIMFQKEFAERLAASNKSKEYCRLSVCAQLFAKTRFMFKVEKKHFSPPPLVDSGVVKIEPVRLNKRFYEDLFGEIEEGDKVKRFLSCFEFVCGVIFGRKNKTLNSIFLKKDAFGRMKKNGLGVGREEMVNILKSEKVQVEIKKKIVEEELGKVRTRSLSVVQIVDVVRLLVKNGLVVRGKIKKDDFGEGSGDEGESESESESD